MMSAFHPKATEQRTQLNVGSVPKADSCSAAKMKSLFDHLIGALFVPNLTYA
jgi:hypothetical protein